MLNPKVSIILPCRNEEKAVGFCIDNIKKIINKHNIDAEIIASDSSKDKSAEIAESLGAKVVKHNKKGYGIALLEGFKAANGRYIFFADADCTYEFREIPRFLHYLKNGYDFVIGNRFKGKIQRGSMPWLHKYLGNPLLSATLRLFFGARIHDAHCGMRAITRKALDKLELKTTGMEFASEMIIKAIKNRLKIKELNINYYKRKGKSKLGSFTDGWRHLRFMLMYAPNYLFMVPGISLMIIGIFIMVLFLIGPIKIFGLTLYTHPIIIGSFFAILGYQVINLGIYARTYAVSTGFEKKDKFIDSIAKYITFEFGLIFGIVLLLIGFFSGLIILLDWIIRGFPGILKINNIILILTLGVLGIQTIFSAFFISILLVEKR